MHRYLAYLHQKLDSIYPSTEIQSFSRLLLNKLAGMSSARIYSDKDTHFPEQTLLQLMSAVDRLAQKEPIQYILGETEFFGLPFRIGPGALIPRPETEELVELIVKDASNNPSMKRILDIGTGSGCIAVSLAKTIRNSLVVGWDISTEAIEIARLNATLNNAGVLYENKDVLNFKSDAKDKASLDIIVSNPPYVRRSEIKEIDTNVLDHEPHIALFVDDSDALIFYRAISELAIELLKKGGSLYFEINSYLGKETLETVQSYPFDTVELIRDLSGKDRMIRAKL